MHAALRHLGQRRCPAPMQPRASLLVFAGEETTVHEAAAPRAAPLTGTNMPSPPAPAGEKQTVHVVVDKDDGIRSDFTMQASACL